MSIVVATSRVPSLGRVKSCTANVHLSTESFVCVCRTNEMQRPLDDEGLSVESVTRPDDRRTLESLPCGDPGLPHGDSSPSTFRIRSCSDSRSPHTYTVVDNYGASIGKHETIFHLFRKFSGYFSGLLTVSSYVNDSRRAKFSVKNVLGVTYIRLRTIFFFEIFMQTHSECLKTSEIYSEEMCG